MLKVVPQEYQAFFPSVTHQKLPRSFDIWETHLADANGRLILGEVEDADSAETDAARQWRAVIDNVRQFVRPDLRLGLIP